MPTCRRHYPGGLAGTDRSWGGLFQPFPWSSAMTAFPALLPGRRPHWSFRGLLNVHSRYGLSTRCTAKRYIVLEGSDGFVTSAAAPIATGWSDPVAGWELHPLKIRSFSRRTIKSDPRPEQRPDRRQDRLLTAFPPAAAIDKLSPLLHPRNWDIMEGEQGCRLTCRCPRSYGPRAGR